MPPDERYFPGSGPGDPRLPDAEDLFDPRPAATPAEVRSELLSAMGQDVPRAPRPQAYPDVYGLAEDLGLT